MQKIYKFSIKFTINYRCNFGEFLMVLGNIPELGNWNFDKALPLHWNQNDVWIGSFDTNELFFEYKYALCRKNGPKIETIKWEDCRNRFIKSNPSTTLCDVWSYPSEFQTNNNSILPILPLPHQNNKIWGVAKPIFQAFKDKKIQNLNDFFDCMLKLVGLSINHPNLTILEAFFSLFDRNMTDTFLQSVLPTLGGVALSIEDPSKFPQKIERLSNGIGGIVKLTKGEVSILLVHMFFCTFYNKIDESILNRHWNFSEIFMKSNRPNKNPVKVEKLKFIYHYFERLEYLESQSTLSFIRVNLPLKNLDSWQSSSNPMTKVTLFDQGRIEEYITNTIQLDFANKYLGGGALDCGMVQEEIRFSINPELIPSMILFDVLNDNEAAIIVGTEQFSTYAGYRDDTKYDGDFNDPSEWLYGDNNEKFRDIVVLAIDAHQYNNPAKQFIQEEVLREVNKAYIGFHGDGKYPEKNGKRKVVTGKWGCGVFFGDCELKFVVQWLAASESGRDMLFSRYGDEKLRNAEIFVEKFKNLTVGKIMQNLMHACESIATKNDKRGIFEIMLSL